MGSLLGPIEIGSRLVYVWPRDLASRRSAHDSPVAILCDNATEKLIDFRVVDNNAAIVELISKVSRAR